jgi:hypothetical protein
MATISDRASTGTHSGLAVAETGFIAAITGVQEQQSSIHSHIP